MAKVCTLLRVGLHLGSRPKKFQNQVILLVESTPCCLIPIGCGYDLGMKL